MSRSDQHKADLKDFPQKHNQVEGATEGGACLTAHYAARSRTEPGQLLEKSCNYRWQGFKKALTETGKYNSPAYSALVGKKLRMRTRGGSAEITVGEGAWNVTPGGNNFRTTCNLPYWHESHHLIPHGVLTDVLATITKGPKQEEYRLCYRGGLLEEKYNLNHMENMVILPLDSYVATAMNLPRHRDDAGTLSHLIYSKKVKRDIQKLFPTVTADEQNHVEKPKYEKVAAGLVDVSKDLRQWVFDAGGKKSLNEAAEKEVADL